MKDHLCLIDLTTQRSHAFNLQPIHHYDFDALDFQLLLHSGPCLLVIEAHRYVLDYVGFVPGAREVYTCMRDTIIARGTDAEYVGDVV